LLILFVFASIRAIRGSNLWLFDFSHEKRKSLPILIVFASIRVIRGSNLWLFDFFRE